MNLKKAIVIMLFSALGMNALNAQENVVKVNPIGLLYGSNLVAYELSLGEKTSGLIGANYSNYKFDGNNKNKSIGGELQFRYYLKESLKGFYGGALGTYATGDTAFVGVKEKFNSFGAGAILGYQWIWGSGFSLDINAGAEYISINYKNKSAVNLARKDNGIIPVLGISLGYAF
ncbi:DUF3575 domain-containing protein [uncultured Lacinutrix sp.]|uniref:DUF3575 domain-containing protein n=1 Tax=uncultured Lacinutrix sp. TaxID=574032 RepID=UPI00262C7CA7|nr:DUF3575 domain-containing protein [uncultured Lacinutrix sp.]